jgi:spore maturation protein CgeB
MQYDYGDEKRGHSYEYISYYKTLVQMQHEVVLFDFMTVLKAQGKERMNQLLLEQAREFKPDVAIFHLYTDQFAVDTIRQLGELTTTLTIFHDDTWRVDFALKWAPHFTFFTTPDPFTVKKYRSLGLNHVRLLPYGCNSALFQKQDVPKQHDVSFVGRWHPYRQWLVNKLERHGIKVLARGPGWKGGMVSHDEMVSLFNESRINLNISNSASWDLRYLMSSPRAWIDRLRSGKTIEQLKARHFEINGCGGFQLSYYVEGLEKQYVLGEEMDIYGSPEELISKIRFYLANEDQREQIAQAGYQRTISDHVSSARFRNLFASMGFAHD